MKAPLWDGSAYRIVPDKELRAELTASAMPQVDWCFRIRKPDKYGEKPPVPKVSGRTIADAVHALASLTMTVVRA